jgi:hypothetical protein
MNAKNTVHAHFNSELENLQEHPKRIEALNFMLLMFLACNSVIQLTRSHDDVLTTIFQ